MPTYTEDDLDGLEEAAENASPDQQSIGLEFVAGVLEGNSITYGVMGGMNFYLPGSGRATGDVDIAVDNPPRMGDLLTVFDNQERVFRPANRMQWVSGVARIFVSVQSQLVQLDLKPKGAEGHLIPSNIAGSVDRMSFRTTQGPFDCYLLAIGPLVAAKIAMPRTPSPPASQAPGLGPGGNGRGSSGGAVYGGYQGRCPVKH
ncbi:hypothetical protein QBC33DRAFT_68820 [Phialemonium atrogriseum]|uniref:Uncharacterized protein n=1 Tax=Phialemonium atrogriseum TaxID=1093897 RepID=A0AAJ0BZK9_9PEZI|nr:uncharacterized protein QBC33DRAFT_68820 [Phialemonium atrogriseum]KAK1767438.1 hypothetical protein QBC33DRAFT_68820 [Phialemonium atrogriseum]